MTYPYSSFRVARPTANLSKIKEFYLDGLGLKEIGNFSDEEIDGIIIGLPSETHHLEFTFHKKHTQNISAPTKDNLLVFYLESTTIRDKIVYRLHSLGFNIVSPENLYWLQHGITIEDPDNWRVVLMDIPNFNSD